ncbi:MAG TPA: hypothetical protein VIG24_14055 [Acidimicrobiia bacterium]
MDPRTATEQTLRLRIAVLEDAIRMHRRMVRDGWTSPWTERDPNDFLWRTVDE